MLSKTQATLRLQRKCVERHHSEELSAVLSIGAVGGGGGGGGGGGEGSRTVDDSLTSLNWLHNLNIMGDMSAPTPPTPPASPGPSVAHHERLDGGAPFLLGGPPSSLHAAGPPMPPGERGTATTAATSGVGVGLGSMSGGRRGARSVSTPSPPADVDYKSNGDVKPPFSYATLICMAMKANRNKMSLSAIYKWIRDNFMYYRRADTGWQNSIRHNLSLNKCFIKVARNKDEPGKGGFWRLDPAYAEEMADGTFKKRRLAARPSAPKKSRPPRKDLLLPPTTDTAQHHSVAPTTTNQNNNHHQNNQHHHQQVNNTSYYMMPPPPPPPAHQATTNTLLLCTQQQQHHPTTLPEDEEAGLAVAALKGDFCWTSVLNEDIEVEGLHYRTADIVDLYRGQPSCAPPPPAHQPHSSSAPYLSSPALSLDDDDLLGAPPSGDACVTEGAPICTSDWWRLTAASLADPLSSFGPGDAYDVATAAFLGPGWDESARPVLDASALDLDGLMDLDY